MSFGPYAPKLWRPANAKARQPWRATPKSDPDLIFGMKAPIVDFFDHDYITKFAPLEYILAGKADAIMEEAYRTDPTEENYIPYTGCGYNFRWIHVPANNMVWVEELITAVCQSKENRRMEQERAGKASKGKPLKPADILSEKYWIGRQRGYLEGSGGQLRHMVPSFTEIFTGQKTSAPEKPLGPHSSNEIKSSANIADASMVLFMPYLHWEVGGKNLDHKNAVIRETMAISDQHNYRQRTAEGMERMEYYSTDLKIIRAFLTSVKELSLHIPKTLTQYYYSTLTDTDESVQDQVVYKFAEKQHRRRMEEKRQEKEQHEARARNRMEGSRWEPAGGRSGILDEIRDKNTAIIEELEAGKAAEHSWDPPKVIMVKQLWMWIIDGDTVITSFPAQNREVLSMEDAANQHDFMEGDTAYDSTDIWRAVQNELRHRTNYGARTAESALDLAWTIADKARGVFQQRKLHPQLQFIQMFETEVNEITFKQKQALSAFRSNIQAAENVNNLSIRRLIMSLANFQKENFATNQTAAWKQKFSQFAIDFKRKWRQIARGTQTETSRTSSDDPSSNRAQPLKRAVSFLTVGSRLADALLPDYTEDDDLWSDRLKSTYNQLEETIENSRSIGTSMKEIEGKILGCLYSRFEDLERIVQKALSAESGKKKLNALLIASRKSFELYTEMVLDNLFDITKETYLVIEIEKILEELKMIISITHEQRAVMNDFFSVLSQARDMTNQNYSSATRLEHLKDLEAYIGELTKLAESTHVALKSLMDLKQKQASVVEARYTRNAAKASADQAEAATSLGYETVKQGWSIMIFTIVTIVFLPLSFFTGLFGMNAKELLSSNISIGFYSAIMYPASFAITCLALGLALNTKFRLLAQLVLRQILKYTFLTWLWRSKFGFGQFADVIYSAIDREKRRRRAKYEFEKWEIGY